MPSRLKRVSAILILFILALCFSLDARAIEPGEVAADFTLPGKTGTVQHSAIKGSVSYLNFRASQCGPCRQPFP